MTGMWPPGFEVPVDVPTGWECPRCHAVYAPLTAECWRCAPPRPVPRLFPHPVGGFRDDGPLDLNGAPFMPVDVPPPVPCPPSREGGMCGCSEPDDSGPVLAAPGYMAEPGHRHVAEIGPGWGEVFPGLEARLACLGTNEDGTTATLDFRLASQDRQQ